MDMRIYHGPSPSPCPSAVALGGFDGLHAGHCAVIAGARAEGLLPSVFTFQTDLFQTGKQVPRLLSQRRKMQLLEEMGIRQCWVAPFEEIRNMEAEEFLSRVLLETCRAKQVSCGYNFRFGKGGKGDSALLEAFCREKGIRAVVQPAVSILGQPVSSTRIRELVAQGDMEKAEALLGRPFSLDTPVIHGRRLGRRLGFPTVNQPIPRDFVLPRFGVYASLVQVGERSYMGVTNVGKKPTVGSPVPLWETWLPEYTGPELYGRTPLTQLLAFIRPEEKFSDLSRLREQIEKDRISAENLQRK